MTGRDGVIDAEALPRRIANLESLLRTSEVLNSTLDLDEVLQLVLDQACLVVDAEAGSLWLLDEAEPGIESRLRPKVAQGGNIEALLRVTLAPGEGLVGQVTLTGEPLLIEDVVHDRRWARRVDETTTFITRSMLCVPLVAHERAIGALQLLNKRGGLFDSGDVQLCLAFASQAAVVIDNSRLYTEQRQLFLSTTTTLAAALDARDPYTHGHSVRVSEYSGFLAGALGWARNDAESLRLAAVLHDLGKIGVRDRVLLKRAKLTQGETRRMQEHPVTGAEIIARIRPRRLMELAVVVARSHQEHWDGKGYPDGLAGEAIPLSARIVTVADVFDALTTDRPYRRGLSLQVARGIMGEMASSSLDSNLNTLFWDALDALVGQPDGDAPQALRELIAKDRATASA